MLKQVKNNIFGNLLTLGHITYLCTICLYLLILHQVFDIMYNPPIPMNSFNLAIEYAKRALMLDNKNSFAYCTLAEAYAAKQDDEGFYQNIELALQYGFPVWEQLDEVVYDKYVKQPRFQTMMVKYKKI